jgi:hypothetical protein
VRSEIPTASAWSLTKGVTVSPFAPICFPTVRFPSIWPVVPGAKRKGASRARARALRRTFIPIMAPVVRDTRLALFGGGYSPPSLFVTAIRGRVVEEALFQQVGVAKPAGVARFMALQLGGVLVAH